MSFDRYASCDDWKTVPADVGAIADHFRLPWRFYARVLAGLGSAPS